MKLDKDLLRLRWGLHIVAVVNGATAGVLLSRSMYLHASVVANGALLCVVVAQGLYRQQTTRDFCRMAVKALEAAANFSRPPESDN